jgi:peptide/nickel transport system substrate-binding protein
VLGLLAAALVFAGALWFALGEALSGGDGEETSQYTEAVVGTPSRINPLFAYLNDADQDLVALVFSGLTRLSQDGTVIPDVAESWEVSPDGRLVTFRLRSGATFHTGTPLTAADAVFTYNLLADPAIQADPDQAPLWRQVHCGDPDPMTVRCELPAPFAPFLAYASVGILPKSLLESTGAPGMLDSPFNQSPVGSGPFRLAQLAGSRAVLEAHPGYHLGTPALEEMVLEFYPDSAAAVASVVRGKAEGILVDSAIPEEDRDELSSTSDLNAYGANRTAYTALYMNGTRPPFNEDAVRQAVAAAVDVDTIIGDVLGGYAARATTAMVPGTWAFNPDIEAYEHNRAAAGATLEEAGWLLADDADVREKNGNLLEVTLLTDRDPVRTALAERVAEDMRDAGFAVMVEAKDSANLINESLLPRNYQAAIFGWDQGLDPDPYPAWHSSQASGNGRNLAEYRSEDADAVMEDGRRTFDLDERQSLYYSFQTIFHDDAPSLILYYPLYTYYLRDNVEGVELGTLFTTGSRFRNVNEWSVGETAPLQDKGKKGQGVATIGIWMTPLGLPPASVSR